MCYFDSLLLPLQSLAHFLSTNHLSPSPYLSFLLLPSPSNPEVGREGGREEGREETGERKKEGRRQGVGREQWVGGGETEKMEKDKGERERHAAITPVAGKFVEAQIRANFPAVNFVEGHFLRTSSDVRVNSVNLTKWIEVI